MNCRSYRESLIELAATGAEPIPELRAHLHRCPSCRDIFERERSLFASIDAGLQSSANTEIPASLLPGVRARIYEPSIHAFDFAIFRKITLALAAAAILLLSVNSLRQQKHIQTTPQSTRQTSPSRPANETLASSRPALPTQHAKNVLNRPATGIRQQSSLRERHEPEIIVSSDQEILLARYADQLDRRQNAPVVVTTASASAEPQLLEFDLIQIAQLDVKPLAERQE